jgi:cyclopropane fatty-acyl-phospholipid synthase-like methyltransferase
MEAFIGAMEVIGRQKAREIARDINLQDRRKLLDIGAGSGVYSRALLEFNPALTATLFDLPVVIEMTRDKMSKSNIADRIRYAEGNYNTDTFPSGHDVALLSAIIHINGRDKNRSLFAKAFKSLQTNGLLIIRDHVMEDSRIAPEDGAIFAVNMLVATREGNTYTFTEIFEDLMAAGFHDIRLVREGSSMDQLITAIK